VTLYLQLKTRRLDLDTPKVMGIVNVTPDSFSDGGRYVNVDTVIAHARRLVDDGAAMLDIGGESTRPGAAVVSEQEELDRVIPAIEALVTRFDVPLSVDTSKPAVMLAAGTAGAEMINDVRALQMPGALAAAVSTGMAVCLMHMQGDPQTMQTAPAYEQPIVDQVLTFLAQRLQATLDAGVAAERIALDPGIGFGKTLAHNLALLAATERFAAVGRPLLVGVSRKSMFGQLLGLPVEVRDPVSAVMAALVTAQGASIIRSHEVAHTFQALAVATALRNAR
jgi:dihydropteroate synthase